MIEVLTKHWKKPLSKINSIASTLAISNKLDSIDKERIGLNLELISTEASELSKRIDNFHEFFQDIQEREEIYLERLILNTLSIIQPSLDELDIEVELNLQNGLGVSTFAHDVGQVLLNFLENSKDAIESNGVKNGKIIIKSYTSGTHKILEVEDNGGGVPQDKINIIFDPHISSKYGRVSLGMSLNTSKMIIENKCGGIIDGYNKENGAVFKIELP